MERAKFVPFVLFDSLPLLSISIHPPSHRTFNFVGCGKSTTYDELSGPKRAKAVRTPGMDAFHSPWHFNPTRPLCSVRSFAADFCFPSVFYLCFIRGQTNTAICQRTTSPPIHGKRSNRKWIATSYAGILAHPEPESSFQPPKPVTGLGRSTISFQPSTNLPAHVLPMSNQGKPGATQTRLSAFECLFFTFRIDVICTFNPLSIWKSSPPQPAAPPKAA